MFSLKVTSFFFFRDKEIRSEYTEYPKTRVVYILHIIQASIKDLLSFATGHVEYSLFDKPEGYEKGILLLSKSNSREVSFISNKYSIVYRMLSTII